MHKEQKSYNTTHYFLIFSTTEVNRKRAPSIIISNLLLYSSSRQYMRPSRVCLFIFILVNDNDQELFTSGAKIWMLKLLNLYLCIETSYVNHEDQVPWSVNGQGNLDRDSQNNQHKAKCHFVVKQWQRRNSSCFIDLECAFSEAIPYKFVKANAQWNALSRSREYF